MKSYTDVEQSNELVKILPIESADMSYYLDFDSEKYEVTTTPYKNLVIPKYVQTYKGFSQAIPCWSLTALLSIIPNYKLSSEHNCHTCTAGTSFGDETVGWFDDPVDACVAMIEKLHNLKMLKL